MYRTFEHTADLGLQIEAADLRTLFAEAGRGLLAVLIENPDAVRPQREVTVAVEGTDPDYLLIDFLNELLFLFERQQLLLCEFDVSLDAHGLRAIARGEPLDRKRHEPSHEIKAITYHQLEVRQTADRWQARFIVDI